MELARRYGPCQIARGVGLDYMTLRLRLAKAVGSPKLVRPAFVQLSATVEQVAPATTIAGATIELFRPPPPRYSLGHPFGDNPLRGANEEEGRNPAGRGSGRRP